ncbi:dipeptide ABC transporter ATP-binding protein [Devosia nitrariae]|nr:ABC transporter ATP-binding protein [Devosia nitrariae]
MDVLTPPAQPLLKVEHLTTTFDAGKVSVKAVTDVSFDVFPGRVVGIVGESGSGKSVTARSIMGLLRAPGRVREGRVLLNGRNLIDLPEGEMRRIRGKQIAMVFQDPQAALNPVMRVGDQIAEALMVHGADAGSARDRAKALLAQVGIPDVERTIDQYPHEFSGGMRQRVVIAIALANDPALLIADEPTTALDVTIQAQILRLLADLGRELNVSIIMITHDMGVVAELCDDLIVMYGGRVVEQGPVRDIFANPRHPYTAALLKAVPRLDTAGDDPLIAIPGAPPVPLRLPPGCAFHPRCSNAVDKCRVEVPPLAPMGDERRSACWVAMAGGDVAPVAAEATMRARHGEREREPALRIEGLRTNVARPGGFLRTSDPVYAVDGVSLEVYPGETLGLVGESGCGKSTLSRTIMGINAVSEGRISVARRDVTAMEPEDRRQVSTTIQYIFQDPFASLNPRRTIGQSITEALNVVGITGAAAETRMVELLERVGLSQDYVPRYPYELSGGQRQRVGIARALSANPRILICDEPVSALDVSIQAQIISLLEELRDDLGLGYLFIAHDLSVVRHISDRVAVMYLGRIVEIGTAEEVYGNPQHPYTVALLSSTPEPNPDRSVENRTILTGDMPSPARPPSGCRFRTRCPIGPAFRSEREICNTTSPDLVETPNGQKAACHFAGEAEPGKA